MPRDSRLHAALGPPCCPLHCPRRGISRNLVAARPDTWLMRLAAQLEPPAGVPCWSDRERGGTDALPMRCANAPLRVHLGRICPRRTSTWLRGCRRGVGRCWPAIHSLCGPPGVLPAAIGRDSGLRAGTRAVGFRPQARLLSGARFCSASSTGNQLPGGDEALACGNAGVAFGSGLARHRRAGRTDSS